MSENLDDLTLDELKARKKKLELQNEIRKLEGKSGWVEGCIKRRPQRSLRQINNELKSKKNNG